MKKLFLSIFLSSLIFSTAFAQQCPSVDEIKAMVKNPPKATAQEYEAILATYSCCAIEEKRNVDSTNIKFKKGCNADEAIKALKKEKVKFPSIAPSLPNLIKNPSPVVRTQAYTLTNLFGGNVASSKDLEIVKTVLANGEKDPYALKVLIFDGIRHLGNKSPEVAEFLLKNAKHESPEVRWAVARALGNEMSNKVAGAVDTVLALTADSNEKVAQTACASAGNLKDEKIIEPLVAILNDAKKDKMHGYCMTGLAGLWVDFPAHKNTSEKAYQAAMAYWKKTPRDNKVPSPTSITPLNISAKAFPDWKARASYFKDDEFLAVMSDLVKDEKANFVVRGNAIKIVSTFLGKAGLEKLEPVVNALSDSKAGQVQTAYQNELKRAK